MDGPADGAITGAGAMVFEPAAAAARYQNFSPRPIATKRVISGFSAVTIERLFGTDEVWQAVSKLNTQKAH